MAHGVDLNKNCSVADELKCHDVCSKYPLFLFNTSLDLHESSHDIQLL